MIRSHMHVAIFAVVWTVISMALSMAISFGLVGLEPSNLNLLTVLLCPLLIAPIVAVFSGRLLLKLHVLTGELQFALNHDPLTKTCTRQYFFDQVQSLKDTGSAAFLMVDIDHFKTVNDTYGHFVGDVVIREVAHRLRSSIRDTDVLARFGGEEFIVLLPGASAKAAQTIAERMRAHVARTPIRTLQTKVPVTVSIGIGTIATTETAQDAMIAADAALYEAKSDGRNLVRCAA